MTFRRRGPGSAGVCKPSQAPCILTPGKGRTQWGSGSATTRTLPAATARGNLTQRGSTACGSASTQARLNASPPGEPASNSSHDKDPGEPSSHNKQEPPLPDPPHLQETSHCLKCSKACGTTASGSTRETDVSAQQTPTLGAVTSGPHHHKPPNALLAYSPVYYPASHGLRSLACERNLSPWTHEESRDLSRSKEGSERLRAAHLKEVTSCLACQDKGRAKITHFYIRRFLLWKGSLEWLSHLPNLHSTHKHREGSNDAKAKGL